MCKMLAVMLFCSLSLIAQDTGSNTTSLTIEKYGLRIHVYQSSVESEKICDLAKMELPVLIGVEDITCLLVLIGDSQSACERLKTLLEKENYTVEIIKLNRVDYTLTPDQMNEIAVGRLCIMQDRRKCIMLDQTTWSWQPVEASYCHDGSQG